MVAGDGFDSAKASLLKADVTGKGHVAKDVLLAVLREVANPGTFDGPQLEDFLSENFPAEHVPIVAFLNFIFQRFPGLAGAEDADLSAVFECIDKNGNGLLEKQEVIDAANSADANLIQLCQQIPALKGFLTAQDWEKGFLQMDTNSDGVISWFEFLQFFSNADKPRAGTTSQEEYLVAVFAFMDTNKNGVLEKSEVMAACSSADSSLREFCTQVPGLAPLLKPETWQATFQSLDTNEDGIVSWAEFVSFFKSQIKC